MVDLAPGHRSDAAIESIDRGGLLRYVESLRLPGAEAEDAVQEVLLRLWLELRSGVEIRKPEAWAFRAASRRAIDQYRRDRTDRRAAARLASVDSEDPARIAEQRSVAQVVDWLPSRRRQVLRLRFFHGAPYAEIAETLDISEAAARSHAHQGLRHLRGLVAEARGHGPARPATERLASTPLQAPGGLVSTGGVDVDALGRLWVVDTVHSAIAIFDRDGRFLERWHGGGGTRFSFRRGFGDLGDIRFAGDGSFYVADPGRARIERYGPDRRLLCAWGSRGHGPGQFLDLWSVRPAPDGLVYASDAVRDDVQVFTPEGRLVRVVGRPGSGRGQLDFHGDAIAWRGEMVVADHANRRLSVFATDGTFLRHLAEGQLDGPDGLDVGPDGRLYVADTRARQVVAVDPDGQVARRWAADGWLVRVLGDGRILSSGSGVAVSKPGLAGIGSR